MRKAKLFFYRVLHYVLRHIAGIDSSIERKMAVLTRSEVTAGYELPPARACKDPVFGDIRIITHAGGGLQGMVYLDCAEAPQAYYAKGNRVFEVDVAQTPDGVFVCSHENVTAEAQVFLNQKIDGRFTPMTVASMLDFAAEHRDVTVIFDGKFDDMTPFARFLKEHTNEKTGKRIIIQVFREKDIADIRAVYDFAMLYVCMYNTDYQQAARICLENNVGAVSISHKALQERVGWDVFEAKNICAFAYTVNSLAQYTWVKEQGLTGVFSDFLLEADVENINC